MQHPGGVLISSRGVWWWLGRGVYEVRWGEIAIPWDSYLNGTHMQYPRKSHLNGPMDPGILRIPLHNIKLLLSYSYQRLTHTLWVERWRKWAHEGVICEWCLCMWWGWSAWFVSVPSITWNNYISGESKQRSEWHWLYHHSSSRKNLPAVPRFPNMEGPTSLCDVLNYSQQLLQVNSTEPATAVTLLLPSRSAEMPVCYLSSILIMLCSIQPCTDPPTYS